MYILFYTSFLCHQICSSAFISEEWIASLFNENTLKLTPLDFRLSAAAQFRTLAYICAFSATSITNYQIEFAMEQLVSARVLPQASFEEQVNVLVTKFHALMYTRVIPKFGVELIMRVIDQARIYSALHTNGFTTSIPGSNEYPVIDGFYPLRDDVNYTTVSYDVIR